MRAEEQGRQVRRALARRASPRRPRGRRRRCRTTCASRSSTPTAKRAIRSRRSRTSWSTRTGGRQGRPRRSRVPLVGAPRRAEACARRSTTRRCPAVVTKVAEAPHWRRRQVQASHRPLLARGVTHGSSTRRRRRAGLARETRTQGAGQRDFAAIVFARCAVIARRHLACRWLLGSRAIASLAASSSGLGVPHVDARGNPRGTRRLRRARRSSTAPWSRRCSRSSSRCRSRSASRSSSPSSRRACSAGRSPSWSSSSRRSRAWSTGCGRRSCWCRCCATTSSRALDEHLGFLPFFRGPHVGLGMLAAGLILAIMVLPYIASVTREVLLRRAAVAARGGARARRDALGDDPRRGAALRALGDHRR